MELLRVGEPGCERPVVQQDGVRYSLEALTSDIDGAFLAGGGIARVREALAAGTLPVHVGEESERVGAPIARPMAVICIGQNYAAHAAESGAAPPAEPVVFLKHPNTVVGPNDDIMLPRGSKALDWEVELAVVIGRRCRYLDSAAQAAAHIAGYAVSHDLSERDFQLARSSGQWSKGKCGETFNPLGPWLVPADEVDAGNLGLRSWVNGEVRQSSSTSDMIVGVAELVWHLSQFMVLEPGDVINTGTPEGVALSGRFPYLQVGDVVRLEIDGLGRAEQRVVPA